MALTIEQLLEELDDAQASVSIKREQYNSELTKWAVYIVVTDKVTSSSVTCYSNGPTAVEAVLKAVTQLQKMVNINFMPKLSNADLPPVAGMIEHQPVQEPKPVDVGVEIPF